MEERLLSTVEENIHPNVREEAGFRGERGRNREGRKRVYLSGKGSLVC